MQKLKHWLFRFIFIVLGFTIIGALLGFVFLDFLVDYWWFDTLNYTSYFLLRGSYRFIVVGAAVLVFFLVFFLNFWLAARFLGAKILSKTTGTKRESAYQGTLLKSFKSGSSKIYTVFSLILAIPVAIPFYNQWERALLCIFGGKAGTNDPAYGTDIGYYLFSFPLFSLIQKEILLAFSLLFLVLMLLYWFESRLLSKRNQSLSVGPRIHLTLLIFLIFFIQAWGYMLQRTALLYTDRKLPIFFGPGTVEMDFILPLIWGSFFLFIAAGLLLVILIHTRKGGKVFLILAVCFLITVGLRNTSFFPQMIEEFIVKPNEIVREKSYIENSIKATLAAFDLDQVETRKYDVKHTTDTSDFGLQTSNLKNIPLWDRNLLNDVYIQRQAISPFYSFPTVDVDRYTVKDFYQQVYLGARELNLSRLPESARGWLNRHLQYSHGYGLVMTPAAQNGDEPMTEFVRNIPLQSDYGFSIREPRIYYGLESYTYAIVPNEIGEVEYSESDTDKVSHYTGKGIPFSSLLKRLLFAVYFRDERVFFVQQTKDDTKLLLRRNIIERIQTITPYFLLDKDPYLVVTPKGLFWIQDAYTTSRWYPNAEVWDGKFNYIRNSVKIVVDAYNGSVDYYIADSDDPLIRAYQQIYPDFLKPLEQMPSELRKHLRYPKDLFEIQMRIYARHHQTDPQIFYQQKDMWDFTNTGPVKSNYLTLSVFDPDNQEFILFAPMRPAKRENLRALVAAGCDEKNYGKIVAFNFPKGKQVYGPSQINSLIDQDTEIAQEITLWDQAGSKVERGRMVILPSDDTVFYIQPVYLMSEKAPRIPELKRIIVSQGEAVAMDRTLEGAFAKLESRLGGHKEQLPQTGTETTVEQQQGESPSDTETDAAESASDANVQQETQTDD
ncbi:UPF0182 family protein [Desulfococcaceae bacterium HSG8]|nr:UPF0182 family protein [Desulfococcaceae bacterium HSG8]